MCWSVCVCVCVRVRVGGVCGVCGVCVCACVCVYSGTEAAAAEEPAEAVCDGVRLKPTASAEECEGSGRQRGRQAR